MHQDGHEWLLCVSIVVYDTRSKHTEYSEETLIVSMFKYLARSTYEAEHRPSMQTPLFGNPYTHHPDFQPDMQEVSSIRECRVLQK